MRFRVISFTSLKSDIDGIFEYNTASSPSNNSALFHEDDNNSENNFMVQPNANSNSFSIEILNSKEGTYSIGTMPYVEDALNDTTSAISTLTTSNGVACLPDNTIFQTSTVTPYVQMQTDAQTVASANVISSPTDSIRSFPLSTGTYSLEPTDHATCLSDINSDATTHDVKSMDGYIADTERDSVRREFPPSSALSEVVASHTISLPCSTDILNLDECVDTYTVQSEEFVKPQGTDIETLTGPDSVKWRHHSTASPEWEEAAGGYIQEESDRTGDGAWKWKKLSEGDGEMETCLHGALQPSVACSGKARHFSCRTSLSESNQIDCTPLPTSTMSDSNHMKATEGGLKENRVHNEQIPIWHPQQTVSRSQQGTDASQVEEESLSVLDSNVVTDHITSATFTESSVYLDPSHLCSTDPTLYYHTDTSGCTSTSTSTSGYILSYSAE